MLKPNYEAEQSVIGIIMMDGKKAMPIAAMKLTEDDFHVPELKTLYGTCLKLFKSGKPVDSVTVLSAVGDAYKPIILTAAQVAPTISNLSAYIDAVKAQSQRITAYNKAMDFISALEETIPSTAECRGQAAEIAACFNNNVLQKAVTAEQGFLDFIDRQEHPKEHIGSGFELLDKFIYIDPGDFIIIGGRPSAGKTAFTLQTMLHMAEKHKVGYFSLETSPAKVFERLISNYAWASFTKIKTNKLDDEDWSHITASYDTFHKLGFEVIPAAGWSVEQIKSFSQIAGYEIIFIDYLTLISAEGKDDTEKATHISKDLHILAQQNGTTVVALSQLKRTGGGELTLDCLRQSGQIEQDADAVILLNYDDETPEVRDIKIAKNKDGKVGKIHANFDGDHQRFSLEETRYTDE